LRLKFAKGSLPDMSCRSEDISIKPQSRRKIEQMYKDRCTKFSAPFLGGTIPTSLQRILSAIYCHRLLKLG